MIVFIGIKGVSCFCLLGYYWRELGILEVGIFLSYLWYLEGVW